MKLADIQDMVEVDLKLDSESLTSESVKTPLLVNKYYRIFLEESDILKKAESRQIRMYKEKYDYYLHLAPDEIYIKKPFNRKVLKSDVDSYIISDSEYIDLDEKINTQRYKVKYVEDIIKQLNQRTYTIKNIIDYKKFVNGGF